MSDFLVDNEAYVIAHEYALIPFSTAKYEPWAIDPDKSMIQIANKDNHSVLLILYDPLQIPKP